MHCFKYEATGPTKITRTIATLKYVKTNFINACVKMPEAVVWPIKALEEFSEQSYFYILQENSQCMRIYKVWRTLHNTHGPQGLERINSGSQLPLRAIPKPTVACFNIFVGGKLLLLSKQRTSWTLFFYFGPVDRDFNLPWCDTC